METGEYIKKRFAQDITEEQLDMLGVPDKCRTCPMIAVEFVDKRNKSIDAIGKATRKKFEETTDLLKEFRSPVASVDIADVHEMVDELAVVVETVHKDEDFYRNFKDFLGEKGTLECDGIIEFDEALAYPRRHTRGPDGQPISGFAIAVCQQDNTYVREVAGYADVSLQQVAITD